MKLTPRKLLKASGLVLLVLIYSSLLIHYLHQPSLKVIAQWKKPSGLHYAGELDYFLSVVEAERDWRGFPINVERRYFIYVGLDPGKPSYGHMIDFTFYPDSKHYRDLAGYLKGSSAEWNDDGVTFVLPSAHRLFIPKTMFIKGR